MPQPASDDAVIAAIYEAALYDADAAALPAVLAGVVGSSSVALFVAEQGVGVGVAVHNIPQSVIDRDFAHYLPLSPLSVAAQVLPPMAVSRGEDLLPLSAYRNTEFFVDFAAPLDTVEVIGSRIPLARGVMAEVCLHRGRRSRSYDQRDVTRVQRFVPHLQRAMQLRRRFPPPGPGLGFAALDMLDEAAVVLGRGGRAIFANRAATAMAAAGDVALGGATVGVTVADTSDQARLAALVRDAMAGGAGGPAVATAPDGGRLFLLVAPLPPRLGVDPGHVLVTLRRADLRPGADPATLRALFGLTAAEARLAGALAGGATIPDLTVAWGLSENTLRSQLSAVFGKTGTRNQRDLVALAASIPRGIR